MQKIVLRELKDEYEYIEVRATTLASVVNPMLYPQNNPLKRNETTLMGDMIHNIVQTCLFSGYEKSKYVCSLLEKEISGYDYWAGAPDMWKKFHKNIYKYADLAYEVSKSLPAPVLVIEKEYRIYIECSGYLVCLGGCADVVLEDGTIIDIKSAAALWDEGKKVMERQQYYYPLLSALAQEKDELPLFEYHVYTKHSPPRLEINSISITKDKARRTLQTDLFMYLSTLKTNGNNQEQAHGAVSEGGEEEGEVQHGEAGQSLFD